MRQRYCVDEAAVRSSQSVQVILPPPLRLHIPSIIWKKKTMTAKTFVSSADREAIDTLSLYLTNIVGGHCEASVA